MSSVVRARFRLVIGLLDQHDSTGTHDTPTEGVHMLLIVSPNLCWDRVVVVRNFTVGAVHRAESAVELASGKGLNVARAARALGIAVRVTGIVGHGPVARAMVRGARARGVQLDPVRVHGAARVCTLVVDPEGGETVINEPGPVVDARTAKRLHVCVRTALRRAAIIVLAGSLPPGLRPEFYGDVIREAGGIPTILDAAHDALTLGMAAGPFLVKANQLELQAALTRDLDTVDAVKQAALELRGTTGSAVLVTLGEHGALLVTGDGTWHLVPPRVQRVNSIGAGDSITAGLAVGISKGLSLLEAARLGVAAATADVTTLLPGTVDASAVSRLVPQVEVRGS